MDDNDHIEELARIAYDHWTITHNRSLPWWRLPPSQQHKYRTLAISIIVADRTYTGQRLAPKTRTIRLLRRKS